MAEESEEVWSPVLPSDLVFANRYDGRVVVHKETERGLCVVGAIARKRDGFWMKREFPLTIVDPDEVEQRLRDRQYITGEQLLLLPNHR